ncbi:MAG: hypothetical protein ACM3JL_01775 [Nitrososphaerota archaeon]
MDHQHPFWEPEPSTPRWAVVVASLILLLGVAAAATIYIGRQGGESGIATRRNSGTGVQTRVKSLPPQPETQTRAKARAPKPTHTHEGVILGPGAEASFGTMAASLPAQVGLAVAPLGGGTIYEFGDLREGHAWSSIKVPILTAVMRGQGETLDPEEEAWATRALTASDNEAAAALFGRLEERYGGLESASRAVESVLRASRDSVTQVATAPPPPGAVSTYGQTEWSLRASVQFYASLADGCLLGPSATEYVTGLMESVIPDQRWGLGEAGFPSEWGVGMKGGWGPEVESGNSYLVRQSGFVRNGDRGVVVAMIAIDESGSFSAGASDLTQMARWLAGALRSLGPTTVTC